MQRKPQEIANGNTQLDPYWSEMPLNLWAGIQGQRLRRAQARHERMVAKAIKDNVSSRRLKQLVMRYDRILLAAVKLVPR